MNADIEKCESEIMTYFRKNVDTLEAYQPGDQPQGVQSDVLKLNTNENPFAPSEKVRRMLSQFPQVDQLRLYPDPLSKQLRLMASKIYRVSEDHIMATNGSDEFLNLCVRAFVDSEETVAFFTPSYTLYETLGKIQGAKTVRIDFNEDYSINFDRVEKSSKLTFLANPNAQSGTFISVDVIKKLADTLSGILVVDEAYVDFAEDHCLRLVDECPNVLVSRSFSKSYALASIRLGLGFGSLELIQGLMKIKDSYNVSRITQCLGEAALLDQEHLLNHVIRIKKNRESLVQSFQGLGFFVYPTEANFVLVELTSVHLAKTMVEELKNQNIFVRYFPCPRLDHCVRITVGTEEQNEQLIEAVKGLALCQNLKEK